MRLRVFGEMIAGALARKEMLAGLFEAQARLNGADRRLDWFLPADEPGGDARSAWQPDS